MLAVKAVIEDVAEAITLAAPFAAGSGDEFKIALFKNNIEGNRNTLIGDLTFADFDGSTPKNVIFGQSEKAINPANGNWQIRLKEPAGGFQFVVTGETNLPQTIYGFMYCDGTSSLWGIENFTTPIVLTAVDQVIDVPQPIFNLPLNPLT